MPRKLIFFYISVSELKTIQKYQFYILDRKSDGQLCIWGNFFQNLVRFRNLCQNFGSANNAGVSIKFDKSRFSISYSASTISSSLRLERSQSATFPNGGFWQQTNFLSSVWILIFGECQKVLFLTYFNIHIQNFSTLPALFNLQRFFRRRTSVLFYASASCLPKAPKICFFFTDLFFYQTHNSLQLTVCLFASRFQVTVLCLKRTNHWKNQTLNFRGNLDDQRPAKSAKKFDTSIET